MKISMKALIGSALLCAASVSFAGKFQTFTMGDLAEEGIQIISPLVTDKFIDHFPAKKWTIVIMSTGYAISNGGGFAHASVGISPAGKNKILPQIQYTAYSGNTGSKHLTSQEIAQLERNAIRGAAELMMTACERTAKCNIYKPY
jgi:hypothetical protein